MEDERIGRLLEEHGDSYRTPANPPVERMWGAIEARLDGEAPRALAPVRRSWTRGLALAAMLLLGIGIGWTGARFAPAGGSALGAATGPEPLAVVPASLEEPSPFVGLARDYFQQTTSLVVALAGDLRGGSVPNGTIRQAQSLLSTTRLLLDGPLPEPAMRDLLQDLELVLAQVARLQAVRYQQPETQLIADAMDQREVLSRLTLIISDRETTP
ncbi:MAG: hypothetical protein R2882_07970 [Gemmatimonadales bacterium]